MCERPCLLTADARGRLAARPDLAAAGRRGAALAPLEPAGLIPLPSASRLFLLPGRSALGFDSRGRLLAAEPPLVAVAAALPPGYLALALAAFSREPGAPGLPLFSYGAVAVWRGQLWTPALRLDRDPRHDPARFDRRAVNRAIRRWLRRYPRNRLLAHHGLNCVRRYSCPNAANLFLRRWEAPAAVSGACNAACQGCISRQPASAAPAPQVRLDFTPTVAEIVELAVPHLERAPRAMISFGQGCEGEPLLRGCLLAEAIREIRRQTRRGTLHLNTNGSRPAVVARLAAAGLDSIRIALNSARPELYTAYFHPRGYGWQQVQESFRTARRAGLWVSVNYLVFPGVNDDPAEIRALHGFLRRTRPRMVQWRNLNIDPDCYLATVQRVCSPSRLPAAGLDRLLADLRQRFPAIRHGCFNPPRTGGGAA